MDQESKNVLVLSTLDESLPCEKFKERVWLKLHRKISNFNDFRIVHLHMISKKDKIPEYYPQFLTKLIRWQPTLILIDGNFWNNYRDFPEEEFKNKCLVLNGRFKKDKMVYYRSLDIFNLEHISDWILIHNERLKDRNITLPFNFNDRKWNDKFVDFYLNKFILATEK